ncbi:MAG: hypothetical protein KKG47_09460 [Proteobacteria bacterium]|nr:hypothetical protein [Pseudomonadota bacterium]MBU1736844.1 hypothetical protein [Pseudomonadota bacterium]
MKFISRWLIPLTLAFLPFSKGLMQFEIGVVTFNPYSMGMIILAAMALLLLVTRTDLTYNFGATDLFIALLCFLFFLSTLLSNSIIESGFIAFHALFIPVVSYFVIKSLIRNEQELHRAFLFLILGVISLGSVQFVSFLKTYSRTIVFEMNPIDFSTLCVTGIFYLLIVRGFRKLSFILLLAILFVLLLINMPRAYLLALLFSPIPYLLIRNGKSGLLMTLLLCTTLISTIFLATNADSFRISARETIRGDAINGIERLTNPTCWKQSLYRRGIHFRQGFHEFAKSPLIGQGMKTGKSRYSWEHTYFTWHSFNLEWLIYGGLIGYLLYSAVMLAFFWSAGRWAREDTITTALLLASAVIMINGTMNGLMHGMMPYALFLLMGFGESRTRTLSEHATI